MPESRKSTRPEIRQLESWKSRNPHKKIPKIRRKKDLLRMLEMRRKVLSQPLDLVYWDKKGRMIPAQLNKRNPQIGAIICRWINKIGRCPPLPNRCPSAAERARHDIIRKARAETARMEEYSPAITDYIVTGGFPIDLLPKSDILKTRGQKTVRVVREEKDCDMIHDSSPYNPLVRQKRTYIPTNPSTWNNLPKSVIFSAHSILRKR